MQPLLTFRTHLGTHRTVAAAMPKAHHRARRSPSRSPMGGIYGTAWRGNPTCCASAFCSPTDPVTTIEPEPLSQGHRQDAGLALAVVPQIVGLQSFVNHQGT